MGVPLIRFMKSVFSPSGRTADSPKSHTLNEPRESKRILDGYSRWMKRIQMNEHFKIHFEFETFKSKCRIGCDISCNQAWPYSNRYPTSLHYPLDSNKVPCMLAEPTSIAQRVDGRALCISSLHPQPSTPSQSRFCRFSVSECKPTSHHILSLKCISYHIVTSAHEHRHMRIVPANNRHPKPLPSTPTKLLRFLHDFQLVQKHVELLSPDSEVGDFHSALQKPK
jgi:hypothetical protein